ncbi:MAG: phosphopantetheine-binding protein [Bacteroidales bacterium]|nr:phosphopantetheine-binding protein [Bacteroidales bacterium]
MEINDFIKDFAEEVELSAESITSQTIYKDIEEWDSLMGLTIMGMVSNKYHVKITGAEIRNNETIEDLFNLINSKIQS